MSCDMVDMIRCFACCQLKDGITFTDSYIFSVKQWSLNLRILGSHILGHCLMDCSTPARVLGKGMF